MKISTPFSNNFVIVQLPMTLLIYHQAGVLNQTFALTIPLSRLSISLPYQSALEHDL
jgi:hypothetical protein